MRAEGSARELAMELLTATGPVLAHIYGIYEELGIDL